MTDVQVTGGVIRGFQAEGVQRFLGVPYAAPPVGHRRMRPPVPVAPWSGVRRAPARAATAPKGEYPLPFQQLFPEVVVAGDHFLNLNVWTPADAGPGSRLPVLVWVHGGSFLFGSGSVTAYDGSAFARDGVVCVTINYRLGAEGFLFTEADFEDGAANLGLQDMVAALHWVQENIATFGGDPSRVTLAGESAGGIAVTTLLAMPSAEGLFSRAIAQSGAAANTLPPETALAVTRALADSLGCRPVRSEIMSVEMDAVIKAASDVMTDIQTSRDVGRWGSLALSTLPFAPVVDGQVLPRHPLHAAAAGAGRDVALLTGSNTQEARLFLVAPGLIDQVDDVYLAEASAVYGLPPQGLATYRRRYAEGSPGDVLAQIVTDWHYTVPAVRLAEARLRGAGPTWLYRFAHPAPGVNNGLGAAHAVEVPYVFDTMHLPELAPLVGTTPSRAAAESTHGLWVRFVSGEDPGWAPYDEASRTVGLLAEAITSFPDPDSDLRLSWSGVC
jgi:para-nitrobenzyl esterase